MSIAKYLAKGYYVYRKFRAHSSGRHSTQNEDKNLQMRLTEMQ